MHKFMSLYVYIFGCVCNAYTWLVYMYVLMRLHCYVHLECVCSKYMFTYAKLIYTCICMYALQTHGWCRYIYFYVHVSALWCILGVCTAVLLQVHTGAVHTFTKGPHTRGNIVAGNSCLQQCCRVYDAMLRCCVLPATVARK